MFWFSRLKFIFFKMPIIGFLILSCTGEDNKRGVRERNGEWITRPQRQEASVRVTASSVSEAESKARDLVRTSLQNVGEILSANAVRL